MISRYLSSTPGSFRLLSDLTLYLLRTCVAKNLCAYLLCLEGRRWPVRPDERAACNACCREPNTRAAAGCPPGAAADVRVSVLRQAEGHSRAGVEHGGWLGRRQCGKPGIFPPATHGDGFAHRSHPRGSAGATPHWANPGITPLVPYGVAHSTTATRHSTTATPPRFADADSVGPAEFDQRLLPGLDTELSLPWPNSLSISLMTSREGSLITGTPVSA